MPSASILEKKKQQVAALSDQLKNSVAGVLVDYKGINVEEDTKLRKELREAGVEYGVVKNTLLHLAAKDAELSGMDAHLSGTTALATSQADYVAAARILCKFAAETKKISVKAGFVEGGMLSAGEVEDLSKLPPREALVAQALGGLNAPITSFVYVLNANITGLARVLGAIAEKQGVQA